MPGRYCGIKPCAAGAGTALTRFDVSEAPRSAGTGGFSRPAALSILVCNWISVGVPGVPVGLFGLFGLLHLEIRLVPAGPGDLVDLLAPLLP